MNLETFIRRPVGTALFAAGAVIVGIVAFEFLPVAPLPQVDFPTINVEAKLPGASAETMASSVATPLERAFSDISGITEMTSSSSLGVAQVTLQFDLSKDINAAAQDVQTAINGAAGNLPKNLPSPPTYSKSNPADAPILALTITSDTLPMTELGRYIEDFVVNQVAQIPGVGLIDYHGQQRPAVRVRLDPDKIAARGLTFDDVRAVIARESLNAPKGALYGPHQAVVLNASDQLLDAAQYRSLVVAYRNGSPVRIADVGDVVDGPEDLRQAGWLQDKAAIIIDVHKQPGYNVVNTVEEIKARLPSINASLPPAAKLVVSSDRTQTIKASVHDVEITMLIAVGLVILVIFLFLGDARATLVPSLAIPLSLVGTFAVMYVLGYSLDNLSLMALTIAVGFVIDDATVVVENVVRHLENGEEPIHAAIVGVREVGSTIVSMTLSLIAVFIPILLMGGIVGRLFREFAVTVSVAVLISGVVSLTVTPMVCALVLRRHRPGSQSRLFVLSERFFGWMVGGYEKALDVVLARRRLTMAVTVASIVLAGFLYAVSSKGFFPEVDSGVVDGFVQAAPDVSYDAMSRRIQAVGRIVMDDPDVDNVYYWIGANPTISRGRMLINLKPSDRRKATAKTIVARIKKRAAMVDGVVLSLAVRQDIRVGGRLTSSQYQYTLQDANIAELSVWSDRMMQAFKALPQLRDVDSDAQAQATSATLRIDRDTASRLGVATQGIDDALYNAFGQRQVATLFTQLNQYHVIEEIDPAFQLTTDALAHLFVRSSSSNDLVPLSLLVTVERGVSPVSITHQSLFPSTTLSFNLAPGVALGDATKAIHDLEARLGKPDSLNGSFQGSAKAFESSLRSQPWLILAALIVVYIVLGILYESLIHPLTIISALPSAGIGALLSLMLFGYDLSIMGLIGIFLLIGIVKKNAIMMIDFALTAQREQGMSPAAAIREGALLRFRPIMMTTMGALMGALPLAFGTGVGAELRTPLGISIAGGLVVSQALTLFTTPVVYLWFDQFSRRKAPVPARPLALDVPEGAA